MLARRRTARDEFFLFPLPHSTLSFFLRQRLAHGGASPDEDAHDDIFGFFVLLFAVERLFPVCRVVVLRLSE